MNKVCFFSSDARPLYKRDVFRAMSYPVDYTIHFRYSPSQIEGDPFSLEGKEGVIFFSMGNDVAIEESQRVITNISIRDVIIQKVEKTENTDLVHFFLKLGDFKEYSIIENKPDIIPPNKFVTTLDLSTGTAIYWHKLIDNIKGSFPNQLFYNFQILNINNKPLNIHFNEIENQSIYKLTDESSYILSMSFYDTEPRSSNNYHSLKITPMNQQYIKIVSPETIDIEARKDNRNYSVFTQTISSSNSFTYLNFETILKSIDPNSQILNKSIVDTTLKVELTKNQNRSLNFALFTTLALIAVAYGKLITDEIDLFGQFSWSLTIQLIIASSIGFFAAYKLYRLFDKK